MVRAALRRDAAFRSGVPAVRRFGVEQCIGPTYRRDAAFRSDASGNCRVDILFSDRLLELAQIWNKLMRKNQFQPFSQVGEKFTIVFP